MLVALSFERGVAGGVADIRALYDAAVVCATERTSNGGSVLDDPAGLRDLVLPDAYVAKPTHGSVSEQVPPTATAFTHFIEVASQKSRASAQAKLLMKKFGSHVAPSAPGL